MFIPSLSDGAVLSEVGFADEDAVDVGGTVDLTNDDVVASVVVDGVIIVVTTVSLLAVIGTLSILS